MPGAVTERFFLRAPPLPSQGPWFSSTAAFFWQSPLPSNILAKYTHLMSKLTPMEWLLDNLFPALI